MERIKPVGEVAKGKRCRVSKPKCTGLTPNVSIVHLAELEPIACKFCGSLDIMKYGIRDGIQNYICKDCGRKFTAKDSPEGMQTPIEQIGASLDMYYDGLSLAEIANHIERTYNNTVNPSTVYRWLLHYTAEAIRLFEPIRAKVSDTWVVDETVINVGGHNIWFWDVIDEKTRFLLASYLSKVRGISEVKIVMGRALRKAGKPPRFIISDRLAAYLDGIEQIFGADSKHIRSYGFTEDINTNLIERFHGTIKNRTKIIRGFKTMTTAGLILSGLVIHYNFFRPHMTLKHKTPAEVAGITPPVKNWIELVRQAR